MSYLILVTLLALVQYAAFGVMVSVARSRLGVPAPQMTGTAAFERISRVHLNTLERLMLFLPLLWLAARSWPPQYMAAIGMVYLAGRLLYWRGYVIRPEARLLGTVLTMLPMGALLVAIVGGLVRDWAA